MGVQGLYKRLEGILWTLNWKDLEHKIPYNHDQAWEKGTQGDKSPTNQLKNLPRRRKLRVGMDISVWIARSCHAFCVSLFIDEHTMSNYERAIMRVVSGTNNETTKKSEEEEFDLKLQEFIAKCAKHVLEQIIMLQGDKNIDIFVVLDGNTPPAKELCSKERSDRRKQAGTTVTSIQLENQYQIEDVESRIQHCIRAAKRSGGYFNSDSKKFLNENESIHAFRLVTSLLIKLLREEGIPFMVSPYESDSQLVYLAQKGYIDLVLTEDSDFYLTCPLVLTKLDSSFIYENNENRGNSSQQQVTSQVKLLRQIDLGAIPEPFSLLDFSPLMLILLMVTAGCDYCKSLYGIGLINARKIVKTSFSDFWVQRGENTSILELIFKKIYQSCKGNEKEKYNSLSKNETTNKYRIEYERKFMSAIIMFRHAVVFCPVLRKNVMMNMPRMNKKDRDNVLLCQYAPYKALQSTNLHDIVGQLYCPKMQIDIAEGVINPRTMKQYSLKSKVTSLLTPPSSDCSSKRKISELGEVSQSIDKTICSRTSNMSHGVSSAVNVQQVCGDDSVSTISSLRPANHQPTWKSHKDNDWPTKKIDSIVGPDSNSSFYLIGGFLNTQLRWNFFNKDKEQQEEAKISTCSSFFQFSSILQFGILFSRGTRMRSHYIYNGFSQLLCLRTTIIISVLFVCSSLNVRVMAYSASDNSRAVMSRLQRSECDLQVSVGRIPGTAMPKEWAASGAKLAFPLKVEFSSDPCSNPFVVEQQIEVPQQRLAPSILKAMKPLNDPTFISSSGIQIIDVTVGAYGCSIQNVQSQQYAIRFCLDFPNGAKRNDVELPAERVFFLSSCWLVEDDDYRDLLERVRLRYRELQKRLTNVQTEISSMISESNSDSGFFQKVLIFGQMSRLEEKKETILEMLDNLEQSYPLQEPEMAPGMEIVRGPNGLIFAKEGVIAVERPINAIHWIGTFSISEFIKNDQ